KKHLKENENRTNPITIGNPALAQGKGAGGRLVVLRTPGEIDLFRSAGASGLGEKASGPGELASQTLGHQPAGHASPRACGPQGSRGEDLGEPRNHPLAVVESGSAVRPWRE
uniref:Uncharacterized protein n=1 Tax=Mustela putorius furo TaxID=9669 RepID=M3XYU2_MUSPF